MAVTITLNLQKGLLQAIAGEGYQRERYFSINLTGPDAQLLQSAQDGELREIQRGESKRDRSRCRSRSGSRGRSRGRSRDRSRCRSRARSRGHFRGRDHSRKQSRIHHRKRSRGSSRSHSRGRSRSHTRGFSRERSREGNVLRDLIARNEDIIVTSLDVQADVKRNTKSYSI